MLFRADKLSLMRQHFKQMQTRYLQRSSVLDDILMSLDDMFGSNSEVYSTFANTMYNACIKSNICIDGDLEKFPSVLAYYGVLTSGVCLGYNLSTGKFALYTSSISVLQALARKNILKGKKIPVDMELVQIEEKLSSGIKRTIREGKGRLCVVRMDTVITEVTQSGEKFIINATMPRSLPTVSDTVFVPFEAYTVAMNFIKDLSYSNILRVTMGNKVRNICMNEALLTQIYGKERTEYLTSFIPNPYTMRLYLPEVGASIYTPGVTNIKLEDVTDIRCVNLTEVDLSNVRVDYRDVKDWVYGYVEKDATIAQKLRQYANVEDLGYIYDNMTSRELWDFAKLAGLNCDEYINNLDSYGEFQPWIGDIDVENLKGLLNKHLLKILLLRRDGKFSYHYYTNSSEILRKYLGSNYFRDYESDGVRSRKFMEMRKLGIPLQDCIDYTGVESDAVAQDMESTSYDNKTVVKQSHLVTARNIQAKDARGYYRNIEPKDIIRLEVKIGM